MDSAERLITVSMGLRVSGLTVFSPAPAQIKVLKQAGKQLAGL